MQQTPFTHSSGIYLVASLSRAIAICSLITRKAAGFQPNSGLRREAHVDVLTWAWRGEAGFSQDPPLPVLPPWEGLEIPTVTVT